MKLTVNDHGVELLGLSPARGERDRRGNARPGKEIGRAHV